MGASQSLPVTHEKLFELTKDTRNVMNILLTFMLKELTVRDFYSLSSPTECKKYVLFMANNLYKHFYELQIAPYKNKQGIIAFRKVQDLITPPNKKEEEMKQGLCLVLAYFYTRIFQIYGAIALSLIDDMNVVSSTGMTAILTDQQRLMTPGRQQYYSTAGDLQGALTLGNFIFLESYLTDKKDYQDTRYTITKYSGSGEQDAKIGFRTEKTSNPAIEQGIFKILYGDKPIGYVDLFAGKEDISGKTILEFKGIRYYKKSTTVETTESIPSSILSSKSYYIQRDGTSYRVDGVDGTITDFFNNIFKGLVPYLKGSSKFGEGVVETSVPSELRIQKTLIALQRDQPLGHCIARAIQLLQSNPFDKSSALSSICTAKFLEKTTTTDDTKQTKITRSGIPVPGESLDSSPGLAALSQLFYEIPIQQSPQLFQPEFGIASIQEYKTFMKNLSILFDDPIKERLKNGAADPMKDDEIKKLKMSDLKDKRDVVVCQALKAKEAITINSSTANEVNKYVRELFKKQYEHSVQCGVIFKELFLIRRDRATGRMIVSLNENILRKGLPEISRINGKARRLLSNYYTQCEKIYTDGMGVIVKQKQATSAATAATATATTAATPATAASAVLGAPAPSAPSAPPAPGAPIGSQPVALQQSKPIKRVSFANKNTRKQLPKP